MLQGLAGIVKGASYLENADYWITTSAGTLGISAVSGNDHLTNRLSHGVCLRRASVAGASDDLAAFRLVGMSLLLQSGAGFLDVSGERVDMLTT